jgi:hypothetical protein
MRGILSAARLISRLGGTTKDNSASDMERSNLKIMLLPHAWSPSCVIVKENRVEYLPE